MMSVSPQAQPSVLTFDDSTVEESATRVLGRGQCLVIPTDTVYGIAARGDDFRGIARLQQLKGRSDGFPPPILVAHPQDVWGLVAPVSDAVHRIAQAYWPGPLTLILPTHRHDLSLSSHLGTLGLRVPDHPQLQKLLSVTGPLAVSSANRHQLPPSTTVQEAMEQFGTDVELYVDGGPTQGLTPSTVVDCTGEITVLRVGLISREDILAQGGNTDA